MHSNGTTPGRALGRALERSSTNEEELDDHSTRLSRIEKQQWAQSGILLLLLNQAFGLHPIEYLSTLLLSLLSL